MELNENRERLEARGLGLAAISYDSVDVLKHFAERKGIQFPLLSDEKSDLIRRFGLLNEEVPKESPFFGVPHPVTYIVDRNGVVVSRHAEADYRRRLTTSAILSERSAAGDVIRHPRLGELRLSASDTVVRGGERIVLYLNVTLPEKMHVYAPGVRGYIPIDLRMKEGGLSEVGAARYPPSRTKRLEAIDESVAVYEGKFEVAREVVIGQSKEVKGIIGDDGRLRVEGTLRFQACDDTKCYVPEELPVSWSFRYEAHDSGRVPEQLRRLK